MNTEFKHIGNTLVDATEEELHIVFTQYLEKTKMSKKRMLDYFSEIIDCRLFWYDGSMREDIEDDY